MKLLSDFGLGFDCASKHEIKTVLNLGVSPEKIVFAHTCKQGSHIKYAAANRVSMMTFDNKEELYKIKRLYPHAELIIRIYTDDSKAKVKVRAGQISSNIF